MELGAFIVQEINSIYKRELSFDISEEIKKRIYDSIIISSENYDKIITLKSRLLPSFGRNNSTLLFSKERGITEYVAMLNSIMLEKSLYRDFYPLRMELHPVDALPAIIAFAENHNSKGYEIIKAVYASYQVSSALGEFLEKGGYYSNNIPIAAGIAAGIGVVNHLDESSFRKLISNSISLATLDIKDNFFISLKASFYSREISFIAKIINDVPDRPVNPNIFKNLREEGLLDLGKDRLLKGALKNFAADDLLLSTVEAINELRERVKGNILDLRIEVPDAVYQRNYREQETGEMKDGSEIKSDIRYVAAYAHFYGFPRTESYSKAFIADPNIKNMMQKIKISKSDKFSELFPEFLATKITYETDEGIFEKEVDLPSGYYRNPLSWNDLKDKGFKILRDSEFNNQLVEFIKNLEDRDIEDLMEVVNHAPVKGK